MSDYVYAKKMNDNGCKKCGGNNANHSDFKFKCEDCGFAFP
jgi:hypothetical protein